MTKSSAKFLNIITHLPNAMLVLSPDFEIVYASKSYLEATMADKRSILGKNMFEAFPDNPNDVRASGVTNLKASLQEVLKTLKPHRIPVQKYDVPMPDGAFQERYWDVVNVPVIGEDNEIEHIIHSVTDVTEQVKTEAALELAVGAAQLGTWEIAMTNHSFLHRNRRHDQIYGYHEPQPTWSHAMAREKILAKDREIYDRAFSEAAKTGKIDFEVRTRWEDGSIHWMEVKGKVYYGLNGKPSKAAGVNIDITEQRLIQKALRKAKEDAESAARAKEEFLSTMSHEIRTPLNAVIGLSNLLLEDNLTESQKANLDSLHFAAGNLLHLINNVLDFSKIQAGKMEVTEEVFDLSGLIHNLVRMHEPKALTKKVGLELALGEKVPQRIGTDPMLLSQILHNLLGNALKFTDKGRISVSIDHFKEEGDRTWLRFMVEDTGKGIAPDKLEYIFEKFAQQRNFSEGNYEGTGLGLSITKSLVETMGGKMKVRSTPGQGSKFSFFLPTTKADASTSAETRAAEGQGGAQDFSGKRILLVEDVEINRNIILQYLKRWWNVVPDEAENGKQALEMVKKTNYDLILMDLRMPVMNGYEASKKIRIFDGFRETPILAFTAETRKINPPYLFNDTIFKPFEPKDLKHKIQKYLGAFEKEEDTKPGPKKEEGEEGESASFDIARYRKMAKGEPEILKKLLTSARKAFMRYKNEFQDAKSGEALSDLVHRNTMNVHYLNAVGLKDKIQRFRTSLAEREEDERLQRKKGEVLAEFDAILQGLEDLMQRLPELTEE